jgi:glycosyltransferase involved in cell wall biosynthesis
MQADSVACWLLAVGCADADFPRFYKAGDALVLPTRGEGWGRPQVEAMAMGLPVISTNWSGITGAARAAA